MELATPGLLDSSLTELPAAETLDLLGIGKWARVLSVAGDATTRRRLLEMGLCRGVRVQAVRRAPFGDPIEFRVRGYLLSLRSEQASLVRVAAGDCCE